MNRYAIAIVVGALLTLCVERASAAEGRRVALVVGVGAYETVPKLPNAVNDASAMSDLFRKAGFEVVTARNDVSNIEFKRSIREFEDSVTDADIAVVYYAGHGIEIRETNYLIPTDAKLVNERDAEDEAISLDRILNALEPAKRLRLVILDACRDNPFTNKIKRRVATRAISAGLGKVEPQQTDTLIAYAAKAQAVANDGDGRHSPFTTALLANLTVPGLDIRLAFGRVRDDVLKATNKMQEPFVYGSLGGGTVALVPARAEVAALTPMANTRGDADLSKSDYEIVERVGTKAAWEVYLNTHKTGLYAELAKVQLSKFATPAQDGITRVAVRTDPGGTEQGMSVSPRADVPSVAPMPKPTAAEARAWDKLKPSSDAAAIAKFIDTYTSSPLIPEAQDRLATVERLARDKEERLRQDREAAKLRDEDDRQKKAAEVERKRLEKEAAKQRDEAEKARVAEAARQKAEALAAARQRDAEERARAAEASARRHEDEETARLAEIAKRRREAEERATALAAERVKIEAEIAANKREAEAAAKAVAAAKAARETEDRARVQALRDQQREEASRAATAAAEAAARETEERERVKAAETAVRQREAEDRRKAAEVARAKADAEMSAEDKAAAEKARVAEVERRKAKASAEAERRKAEEAAQAAAELKAERAAAARRREAADERRQEAEEAAAANRRKAEAASRRAAERQAEQASAAAEQRRRAAAAAKEASRARAAQAARPRPAPAPRMRAEARAYVPAPRSSGGGGGGGGGGSSPMVGIGF